MFTEVAPRYDLLNHALSCNIDRIWWWRAARTFLPHPSQKPNADILDLCCGTGRYDSRAEEARRRCPQPDRRGRFCSRNAELAQLRRPPIRTCFCSRVDALQLPVSDSSFDLVTSAFGFRNLANYDAGLREIYRVLAPGGEIGILDFRRARRGSWESCTAHISVMCCRGSVGLISGVRGAYTYLPASVETFPEPAEMMQRMRVGGI